MANQDFRIKNGLQVGTSNTLGISTDGKIFVVTSNGDVGIGTTRPTSKIDIRGNVNILGVVTATSYGAISATSISGNGSGLTSLNADNLSSGTIPRARLSGTYDISVTGSVTGDTISVSTATVTNNLVVGPIGSATTYVTVRNGDINVSGIGTIPTLSGTTATYGTGNFTTGNIVTGVVTTLTSTNATLTNINSTGISTLGITSTTNLTAQQLNVSGVSTFGGSITGTISTATKLQNARTFEITGDVVASQISFDGTGNVSLAATIQPNSVALGTDTTGDYVQSVSGTANQITVTGGTGEGSTPTLSIPSQFTAPQDVTVTRDLQVSRNLNVTGNITIGGTSAVIYATELKVSDPDLVLGVRTDGSGNDVSNDTTANHGGIAIASTEGSPLVSLYNPGIGESTLPTYKKIMWFKSGAFAGLNTDAWLFNYAVGIGSTQFPSGTRLAVGNVQFTQNDLAVVRNINASGVSTFAGITTVTGSTLFAKQLSVSGVSTFRDISVSDNNILSFVGGSSVFSNPQITIAARNSSGNIYELYAYDVTSGTDYVIENIKSNTERQFLIPNNGKFVIAYDGTFPASDYNYAFKVDIDAETSLYFNQSEKLTTTGAGVTVTGTTFTNQLNVSGVSTFASNVLIPSSGIGIGTTSIKPGYELDVRGSTYITGDIKLDSTTNELSLKGRPNYITGGNYPIITISAPSGGNLYALYGWEDTGNDRIYQQLTNSTDFFTALSSDSQFVIGESGGLLDGSAYAFKVGIDSSTSLYFNKSKKLETTGAGATVTGTLFTNQLSVSGVSTFSSLSSLNVGIGGTIITTTSSGLVGIGTTNPKATLEVVGSMVADGIDIRNLPRTQLVSYASASEVSNSALSISGISTYTLVGSYSTTYSFSYSGPAISADGGTIIVGDWNANDTGATYVYNRVGAGNSIVQVGVLTAGIFASSGDAFGYSVATSADGKTIAVGALGDQLSTAVQSGSVYIFDRIGNSFNQVGILTGVYSTVAYEFGERLVVSGDGKTILVGAPTDELSGTLGYGLVYVFDRIGNSFNQVGILTGSLAINSSDRFGDSVATSYDGKSIIVGAPNDEKTGSGSGSGVVYVFDRIGNSFNQVGILTGSFAFNASDSFGSSVATSVDGKSIVVGAQYDETGASLSTGVVYVFDRTGNSFNQVGILTSSGGNVLFGHAVSASADGKTIASYPYGGSYVSIHKREGNSFNEVTRISYTGNLTEQQKISLTADGKTLILSNEQGVYVHDEVKDTYLYSGPTGNIGIGTSNPTSKLHVIGDTTITGNLNAPGNYYVKLGRTSNQTILNGVDTLIGFTASSDTNGWYSGITTRTTPTVAGTYQVQAMLNWQAGSTTNTAQSNIQLRKNANTFAISIVGIQTFQYSQFICGIVTMNGSTDYIDFTAYTSNPTSQAVTGDASGLYTKMEIFKIN